MVDNAQTEATIPHGEEIVERFGGIRPMAAKLEVPVTTVQGWKKRDAIPLSRRDDIITAASQYNISLKGLISDNVANQNSRIEEDPALRPITSAPAAARPVPSAQNNGHGHDQHIDLKQLRRSARTTSIITTASLVAIIAIAGVALFGGDVRNQQSQITSLQNRVSGIESQQPAANGLPSGLNATITELQGQVQSITRAIGATGQDLAASGTTLLARLQTLEAQLGSNPNAANLQGALQQMQTMATSAQGAADWEAALADLRNVVGGLQGRMDGLDGALAEAKTQNDALGTTLANVTGRDLSAAAMLLALTQLREAVDRQAPFADDLNLLRQVAAGTDPELVASVDRLAPYAESGVMSPETLKTELQALSSEIVTAKLKGENVSLKDRVMARLQGLFTLKKDGVPVTGGEERALIAKASTQLDNNDVAGAVATLQQLQGPAADVTQPWQQQAGATLAVQAIDQQLVNSLMSKIRGLTNGGGVTGVSSGPINLSAPAVQAQPQMQAPAPAAQAPAAPIMVPQTQGLLEMPAPSQPTLEEPQPSVEQPAPQSAPQPSVTIQQ